MTQDSHDQHSPADQEEGYEGPDVERSEGDEKPGGLGQDGTIPDEPDGVAAGHTGEPSSFEPEEDEQAGA
ncbi:hypothetical protein HDC37_002680 [Microbacterium sp. AK009]|uniref:hypothetical protein n=1 Tax=Microbacterium sp. AK009 TaxID=2723068 RepID=UPI0015C84AD9|nr:hypothetical protein [Microbacterium sp. AK009]NYF17835.1 hypothetical protein [Microbacterium sp. AK009]